MTLELEGLTKVYKDKTALDDVSFSFPYNRLRKSIAAEASFAFFATPMEPFILDER